MLIKFIGSMVIVGTCFAVGYEISKELTGRVRILGDVITSLEKMHSLISYTKAPLAEIYAELADSGGVVGNFFLSINWTLPPSESWRANMKFLPYITKDDKKILCRLADTLGRCDCEMQLKDIRVAIMNLESARRQAQAIEARDGGVCKSLSLFAGIGIAVMLM